MMLMTLCTKKKKKKRESHVWANKRKEVSQQNRTEGNRQKARMLRDTLSQSHNLTLQAASTKNGHSRNSHNTILYSHTVAQVAEGSCSDLSLPLQKGSTSQLKEEATALSSPARTPIIDKRVTAVDCYLHCQSVGSQELLPFFLTLC